MDRILRNAYARDDLLSAYSNYLSSQGYYANLGQTINFTMYIWTIMTSRHPLHVELSNNYQNSLTLKSCVSQEY